MLIRTNSKHLEVCMGYGNYLTQETLRYQSPTPLHFSNSTKYIFYAITFFFTSNSSKYIFHAITFFFTLNTRRSSFIFTSSVSPWNNCLRRLTLNLPQPSNSTPNSNCTRRTQTVSSTGHDLFTTLARPNTNAWSLDRVFTTEGASVWAMLGDFDFA